MEEGCGEFSGKSSSKPNHKERPLKKARYIWELKGKHHLKEAVGSSTSCLNSPSDSDGDSDPEVVHLKHKLQNHKSTKQCFIDRLLLQSESLMDNNCDSKLPFNIDKSIHDEIPVTLVSSTNQIHDDYLLKWQARQVAKSFVDNTINRIIEHWKLFPLDASDFVENCENDEQVEDEGILMAIKSHGLHSSLESVENNCFFMDHDYISQSRQDNYENFRTERLQNVAEEQDPMEFLNAAVSVAIQKKGLSSYTYS